MLLVVTRVSLTSQHPSVPLANCWDDKDCPEGETGTYSHGNCGCGPLAPLLEQGEGREGCAVPEAGPAVLVWAPSLPPIKPMPHTLLRTHGDLRPWSSFCVFKA